MTDRPDPRLARRMRRAIRRLPRRQREVFCAVRYDDLSYAQIAKRTGLSATQVEALFADALASFVRTIDAEPRHWWRFW